MTGSAERRSLHLDPPNVLSDESLGERLAALARSSAPTASPRARRRWGLPVAGAVFALATAGATFGADQVRHHGDRPQPVVPAAHLEPSTVRSPLVPNPADEQVDHVQPVEPTTTLRPADAGDGHPLSDSHRRTSTPAAASHPGDDSDDESGTETDGSERSEPSDHDSAPQDASEDGHDGSGDRRDSGDDATRDDGSDSDGGTGGTGEHDG